MAKRQRRCPTTPDLFTGAVAASSPIQPLIAQVAKPSWQQLEQERLAGLQPPTDLAQNPIATLCLEMYEALQPWLRNYNIQARAPVALVTLHLAPKPKQLPVVAKRIWALIHLMQLNDRLIRLYLRQRHVPDADPDLLHLTAETQQLIQRCRFGLALVVPTLSYAEALHWEWVHAWLYWHPAYVQQMAQKGDWRQLGVDRPERWAQHPGSRPFLGNGDLDDDFRRPSQQGLPPRYPRWVFQLHLEVLGPRVQKLAAHPRDHVPSSPMQRTFWQTQRAAPTKAQRKRHRAALNEAHSGQSQLF